MKQQKILCYLPVGFDSFIAKQKKLYLFLKDLENHIEKN